jgi:hypothetical protein
MGRRHVPTGGKRNRSNEAADSPAVCVGEKPQGFLVVRALGHGPVDQNVGIEQNSHRGNCALEEESRVGKGKTRGPVEGSTDPHRPGDTIGKDGEAEATSQIV